MLGGFQGIPGIISQNIVSKRNNATLNTLKKVFNASIVRVGEWKLIKVPPVQGPKTLKNRYIPFSKRFLFREIVSDSNIIFPKRREAFERIALFMDEKIAHQYRVQSEEISLLLKALISSKYSSLLSQSSDLTDAELPSKEDLTRRQRLDQEYWFLRKLAELAPAGGFDEVSQEALQASCLPRASRASRVKTYVNPSDYDVLRVWTRGLHPSRMYPIDRYLRQRPQTEVPMTRESRLLTWFNRLTNLITPRPMAIVSKEDLCYGHVLVAYRLKQSDTLKLHMMKHVPVSATADGNLFAEGVIDMLPEHRHLGLSRTSKAVVSTSGAVAVGSLFVVTPLAFMLGISDSELFLAWSFSAFAASVAVGAVVALRHWKIVADWSERLRSLSLACEFNSGSFALAHFLGLSQAELLKSAMLVYSLLLQPSESQTPLNLSQLEIRVESWIARRLSPHAYLSLPASMESSYPSKLVSKLFPSKLSMSNSVFQGGSGPLFDLQFDARPALQLLRQLDLVRGSDEKLTAVPMESVPSLSSSSSTFSSALHAESEEDDLGFPRVAIKQ